MQAETTIYFMVWWVLFEYSSFDHFPKRICTCKECKTEEEFSTLFSAMASKQHSMSVNVLDSMKRVIGTPTEYQLIIVKDSSDRHQIVNTCIGLAMKYRAAS